MQAAGAAALRDPARRLPGGFWAAAGVWLERPQVANRRLSGACAERPLRVPRAGCGGGAAGPAERAWAAFCGGAAAAGLGLGAPAEAPLELVLRSLLPRRAAAAAPVPELVVRDVFNGSVTFLPLEQTCEGQYKVKVGNIYQIRLQHVRDDEWTVSVFLNPEKYVSDGIVYPKATWLGSELLSKLVKWSTEITKNEFKSTLSLISVARYSKVYQDLKEKYKEIVKVWPEVTDPEKFVYEDVAIATYLLILWEDERTLRSLSKKQSFVDLGCGNGLLVHILSNEGHPGKGIDVRGRKIWEMYGPQTCLEENAVNPNNLYPDVDWLIGNHSDELTPWIPVIAARSSHSCRYFLLPCCFFDFHGKYNRRQSKKSQYREYLDFVTEVGVVCGFHVEEDCLRIPSTKRVCLIGMSRTYLATQDSAFEEQRRQYIRKRQSCNVIVASEKRDGLHQDLSLSAAGLVPREEASQERDGRTVLPSGFLLRGKEQVRNCTALPHEFVDQVALKVAHLLLSESEQSLHGHSSPWNRGESLPLSEIAERLDKDTLKALKKECGGLQTLLRNNCQVFKVQNGRVHIRDWGGEERPRKQLRRQRTKPRLPSPAIKTRLCWFYAHHPQGCPLTSASCAYAHGAAELNQRKVTPSNKELPVQLR